MVKKDSLHQLILKLTKEEKKIFKFQSYNIIKKDNSNYLKLFDILSKMKEYDERKLLEKIKPFVSATNLNQTKKYLKDSIIDAIINKKFTSEISLVDNYIKVFKFYRSKTMISESGKALRIAKKMAIKYQTYDLHLDILNYELNYVLKTNFKNLDAFFVSYNKEREEVLRKHKLLRDLEEILNITFLTYQQKHTKSSKEELENIRIKLQSITLNNFNDFRILNRFYRISSFYNLMIGNKELDSFYVKMIKELYEKNQDFIIFEREAYINSIINYLGTLFNLGNFELLKKEILFYRIFNTKSENEKINLMSALIKYESLVFLNTGSYEVSLNEIKVFLDKHNNELSDTYILSVCWNYALLNFFYGAFDEVIFWLNKVYQTNLQGRLDLQTKVVILKLIVNYELKNYEYVHSIIRSFKRSYNLSLYENEFIILLKDLIKTENIKMIEKFKFDILKPSGNNSYPFTFLWIDSKISKKTIKDLYLESLNK